MHPFTLRAVQGTVVAEKELHDKEYSPGEFPKIADLARFCNPEKGETKMHTMLRGTMTQ